MTLFADTVRGLSSGLIIAAIFVAALVLGREILVPLALATIVAFILAPAVHRLSRIGIPRGMAAGLCVAIITGLVAAASITFSSQLLSLAGEMSAHRDNIIRKVRSAASFARSDGVIARATNSIESLGKEVRLALDAKYEQASPADQTGASAPPKPTGGETRHLGVDVPGLAQLEKIVAPLTTAGLTLLFTVFLLAQYESLRDRIVRLAGTDNITITAAALTDVGERLSSMFTLQAILNIGFGAIVAIALTVIGVPNAVMWGAATALLRFVPFIGSILAALPPMLLAAAVDPGWGKPIATLIFFIVGEVTVGHFIEPLVLGRKAGLSPLAFLLAASFWTLVWGPIGLILAAPITMCLVVLGLYIPRFEFLSVLLGDAPPLTPSQEFYHRLLSGQALAAYKQLEATEEDDAGASTMDDIVLPALQQAARDKRMGRIADEQIEAVRAALAEVQEFIAAQDEPQPTQSFATDIPMLFIAGRGPIDLMAASYLASTVARDSSKEAILVESATGLMALQSARNALNGRTPGHIFIVSVGGLDNYFTRLLEKRAAKEFPGARIITCNLGSVHGDQAGVRAGRMADATTSISCTSFRALRELATSELSRCA